MARRFHVVVAGIVLVVGCVDPAVAAGEGQLRSSPSIAGGSASATGELAGIVTASDGVPVEDVLVSLSGPVGSALTVSDSAGRFWFDGLAAGRYLLRTHLTGAGSSRRFVHVEPGQAVFEPVVLNASGDSNRQILLAGSTFQFGNAPVARVPADDEAASSGQSAAGEQPNTSTPEQSAAVPAPPPDARMWRLRRARRSVLKDRVTGAALVQRGGAAAPGSTEAAAVAERWTAAGYAPLERPLTGLAGLPISGEVQLLTRATLAGPSFVWPSQTWPGQVAYVSVAPSGAGDWTLRGTVDMTTGQTSSWAVASWYSAAPREDHDLDLALSYSRQAHAAAADLRFDGAARVDTGVPRREVARMEAADTWTVSPALEVGYGAELAQYWYLRDGRLFSPRASVALSPVEGIRVRAAASRNMTAPGGEQFLPPLDGVWLPPERTYSSLSGLEDLQAERVRHVEVGLEHEFRGGSVVGVRRFSQEVDSQLMAMFAPGVHAPLGALPASGGHYYLTGVGGVDMDGWAVSFDHALEDRLRGAVDYRLVRSAWAPFGAEGAAEPAAAWVRSGTDHFHDVAATLEAVIPETSTHVVARCRVSTAFASPDGAGTVLATRFDVQVTQSLPFAPFEGSSWELLVALRSLFHEPSRGASLYDELLVVDPPRQLVGGLVVHF